jgi:DNA polymerase III subunit delta
MAKKATAPKSSTITGFDVLLEPESITPPAVCAIVGGDGFLQHEVRRALIAAAYGPDNDATPDILDGELAHLRDVLDAVSEMSLFGSGRRVVVVEEADALVKEFREGLEDYVARPRSGAVLILEVATFPANTRLAKAVASSGLIVKCTMPDKGAEVTQFNRQLKDWLIAIAKRHFDCTLGRDAVELLVDLVPPEPGILYQEVDRLSLLAGTAKKITADLVAENVGGWRTRKTWDMIDAAADGRATDALEQLDRLLAAGEEPQGLLPQMASTFRKFAMAVRLFDQAERSGRPLSIRQAVERAGVLPFKLNDAERQLRQIGRPRARQLYRWLLAADLETKGYNSAKDRARRVLETLIIRLSREANPDAAQR